MSDFISDFEDYEGCVPPGVRLPEINIEKKYYVSLGVEESILIF